VAQVDTLVHSAGVNSPWRVIAQDHNDRKSSDETFRQINMYLLTLKIADQVENLLINGLEE